MLDCLKKFYNAKFAFDLNNPIVNDSVFERRNWTSIKFVYVLKEGGDITFSIVHPIGSIFATRAKVKANNASTTVTGRTMTRFIVYLNRFPIICNSKK